jgi:hypothetical protein
MEEQEQNEQDSAGNTPGQLKGDRIIAEIGGLILSAGALCAVIASVVGPGMHTMGSSATDHLGKDGKPILMELRNCRMMSAADPRQIR